MIKRYAKMTIEDEEGRELRVTAVDSEDYVLFTVGSQSGAAMTVEIPVSDLTEIHNFIGALI